METVTGPHLDTTESRSPRRRAVRVALLVSGALFAVLAAALVVLLVARSGVVLPGVTVGGTDLGGLDREQAREVVAALARDRAGEPVVVVRDESRVEGTAAALGYALDVEATVDDAVRRGRQANPFAALRDHVRAFRGETPVPPHEAVDGAALSAWALSTAEVLSSDPVEGTLRFDGASVERVDPAAGQRVPVEPLRSALRTAVLAPGPQVVEAPSEVLEPVTTQADVDAVHELAERAVSAPVTLSRDDRSVTFDPDDIGDALRVARTAGDRGLELRIDQAAVAAAVPDEVVAGLNTDPTDARITVSGGDVSISESSPGFRYEPAAAADQLLEVATGDGDREATLDGEVLEPDLSTADAEALEIVEPIGSFTTSHACCEGRVRNIQRMADMVDGALIKPGETFSVNGHVGPRTRDKGFTDGAMIIHGEFEDVVGGGVSQFATTMYNAAYFAGFDIPEHQAHSYYISRYPAGREATLNYDTIDLKVRNSSPYGALIKTSHTPTSITVTFWGKQWVEVESVTGPRRNVRPGTVRDGFDITVTRILRYPDGREEREEQFTRYNPEFG